MADAQRTGEHLHAVIMAGGRGTRFWPLSTARRPKQLLRITGRRTMIQETVARLEGLVPLERIWVVTGSQEAATLREQLPDLPADRILVEPVGRDTAPCIAMAALQVGRHDRRAVMAVLPADHHIGEPETFRAALAAAAGIAARQPRLITIGVTPTHAETGYGYIQRRDARDGAGGFTIHDVGVFREKPDRATAERLVASGDYLWNAGIFVWQVAVIEEELRAHLPALVRALEPLREAADAGTDAERLAAAYETIEPVSIDHGVLEHSSRVWVMPCAFGWSDVGSWAALAPLLAHDASGNATRGEAVLVDAHDNLVVAEDRLVAAIGVEDLVIVATGGAVLVCPRNRAQDVREVVAELERRGRADLL